MAEEQAAGTQEQPQQQFAVQRIYTRDVSLESPAAPGIFKKQWQPQVNVDLGTKSEKIDETGNYEVVLTITITSKLDEETAFLIEVQQAGIFFITGFSAEELRRIMGTTAPNILFPYARECIDNLCVKGGFPPVMLAPINFDAMYQQALAQAQDGQPAGDPATH
jgi:preprotein translocase subunit SecB